MVTIGGWGVGFGAWSEIPEKLLKLRFHILFILIFSLLAVVFIKCAPSFKDIFVFFLPLLVSTSLFMAAVEVLRRITPPNAEVPGDGIFDIVSEDHNQNRNRVHKAE
ncbi:hypothetical protein Dimus_019215 [Dionaea muscipula]